MTLTVGDFDQGTSEAEWLGSTRWPTSASVEWGVPGRVVVVAPHPDDEVLAAGGTMRELARAGWDVRIVAVTEGEASHPRSPTVSPDAMAEKRAHERAAALARLGMSHERVTRLHFPDGNVQGTPGLTKRLLAALDGAAWCLAPWHCDGHPDHDAVGAAASAACIEAGVALVQYPVWAWHWLHPSSDVFPWDRVRCVRLSPQAAAAKRCAVHAYQSQIAPLGPDPGDETVLPAGVLARFDRPFETFFR
jgi:LmbE family N-acetylglucosaminyl deacetylase